MKIIGYLRVSTDKQNTKKNKLDIYEFCNKKGLGTPDFAEEVISGAKDWKKREIRKVIDSLNNGDILIVPEISRLSRSLLQIIEILKIAKEKGIIIYDIKGGFELNGSLQSKVYCYTLGMVAEIERDLISQRVSEGIRARQAIGKHFGRKKGVPGKSKLDEFRNEIISLIKAGVPKTKISKKFNTSVQNLIHWLKMNDLKHIKAEI